MKHKIEIMNKDWIIEVLESSDMGIVEAVEFLMDEGIDFDEIENVVYELDIDGLGKYFDKIFRR